MDYKKAGEWFDELLVVCRAAEHALRSYQYGNISPELAEQVADRLQALVNEVANRWKVNERWEEDICDCVDVTRTVNSGDSDRYPGNLASHQKKDGVRWKR